MFDMADSKQWAPYAPPSTVLHVINHYRQRDVPGKVTPTDLIQIGVSASLAPRTMGALEFLGLIDEEEGTTTDAFRALRFANDEQFPSVLAGVLQGAYKDIFDHVDPGTATLAAITNAFFPYSPGGQRDRMVILFLGLVAAAGLPIKEAPKQMPRRTAAARPAKSPAPRAPGTPSNPTRADRRPHGGEAGGFTTGDVLMGVTEDDLATLSPEAFERVWGALGELALARARARADAAAAVVAAATQASPAKGQSDASEEPQ
jgi:hypothetical protein